MATARCAAREVVTPRWLFGAMLCRPSMIATSSTVLSMMR